MTRPNIEQLEKRSLLSTYVVTPTGSDSSPGSAAAPWRTLQHAASAVGPGDVVNVQPGNYTGFIMGWDGRPPNAVDLPITFKGGAGVLIVARNNKTPDGINLEGADHVTIDGFTIAPAADQEGWRAGIRAVQDHDVQILNNVVTMRSTDRYGVFSSFTNNLRVAGNDVSGPGNSGIYTSNSATNPVVEDNVVHDMGGNGLHFNGDSSQGGTGVVTGAVVRGNTVYEVGGKAGGSAINMDGVQQSRIVNNKLYKNHAKGISLYQTDSAEPSSNNIIDSNDVRMAGDARGYALTIKNASVGNTVIGNVLDNGNRRQGSLNVELQSLKDFHSDNNTITTGITVNDGWTRLTLAEWQTKYRQDLNSKDSAKDLKATQVKWILTQKAMYLGELLIGTMVLVACVAISRLRKRGVYRWLKSYFIQMFRRQAPAESETVHLLLCVADHFEPHNGKASDAKARERVKAWTEQYPRLFGQFRDSDGIPPKHTFFYPMEQYQSWVIDELSDLCDRGFGEVEIHLHHDHDTSDSLRQKLAGYKELLVGTHDLLPRDRITGEAKYGFIHGNWALDNSRSDGCWCGVNNELDVLRETGCYCDFTLPSAPSDTQTSKINSIYYAVDHPAKSRSHDTGTDVGTAPRPPNSLMLIQGPLLLNWSNRKWGLLPRIENACLQGSQPPTMARLDRWLRARVQVSQRRDWFFVKLHTHGAPSENQKVLLGEPMVKFHQALIERAQKNPNFHFHYVTAREMYNLARAAEAGFSGSVNDARNYELVLSNERRSSENQSRETSLETATVSH